MGRKGFGWMKMRLGTFGRLGKKMLASHIPTCLPVEVGMNEQVDASLGYVGFDPFLCGFGQVSTALGFSHFMQPCGRPCGHRGYTDQITRGSGFVAGRESNEAGYWELAGGLQGSAGLRWAGTPAPWCRGSVLQLALAGSGPSGGGGGRWISVCRTVTSPLLLNVVKLERLLI